MSIRLLTLHDVMKQTGWSRRTVDRRAAAGELRKVKFGTARSNRVYFVAAELDAYIRAHLTGGASPAATAEPATAEPATTDGTKRASRSRRRTSSARRATGRQ